MAGRTPSFLGSPGLTDRSVSVYSVDQSVRNHLHEVEDNDINEDEIEENPPLSPQGETTPPRDQPTAPLPVRRPRGPPGPGSLTSSKGPEGITTLVPADPFATILNPRKCKAHSEVFSASTGRPKGNNLNHIILGDAGMAIAKRVLHPPEAERWPSVNASAFMKKYLTLVQTRR